MKRKTAEVDIELHLGEGGSIETGDKVFDHMLNTLFFYMDKKVKLDARGDLSHHLWEDTAIVLGQEINDNYDRNRIARFGDSIMPMDDALVLTCVDISRSFLNFDLEVKAREEGFNPVLAEEFLRGLSRSLEATIHVKKLSGKNPHHLIEACFKGLGVALGKALGESENSKSTKGVL